MFEKNVSKKPLLIRDEVRKKTCQVCIQMTLEHYLKAFSVMLEGAPVREYPESHFLIFFLHLPDPGVVVV